MVIFSRLLAAVDFSDTSRAAFEYGSALASRLGARVTAVHVMPTTFHYYPWPAFPPPPAALDPAHKESVIDELRRFVQSASGVPPAEAVVRDGDPADEILAQAAASDADLVVLGTHGRRGFERWILGSVAERVARRAERAVLVVPPGAPTAITRVLCAVDLTDTSSQTLAHAVRLARAVSAELIVLYVAADVRWYEPWPIAGVDSEAVRSAVSASTQERLDALVARDVPAGVRVEGRVAFGSPQREIERAAADADIVVLGASSSGAVDRLFFGSTAQHVVRSGVRPVLLVRHAAPAPEHARDA